MKCHCWREIFIFLKKIRLYEHGFHKVWVGETQGASDGRLRQVCKISDDDVLRPAGQVTVSRVITAIELQVTCVQVSFLPQSHREASLLVTGQWHLRLSLRRHQEVSHSNLAPAMSWSIASGREHGKTLTESVPLLLISQTPPIQQPSSGRACGDDPRRCYSGLNGDHFKSHFKSSYVSDNRMWLAGDTAPLSSRMYRQYIVSWWVFMPVSKIQDLKSM